MANERGLIPKARREELSEELRGLLSQCLLEATWGFIRYIYGGGSSVEPELFELVRVKLAWNNQCVH